MASPHRLKVFAYVPADPNWNVPAEWVEAPHLANIWNVGVTGPPPASQVADEGEGEGHVAAVDADSNPIAAFEHGLPLRRTGPRASSIVAAAGARECARAFISVDDAAAAARKAAEKAAKGGLSRECNWDETKTCFCVSNVGIHADNALDEADAVLLDCCASLVSELVMGSSARREIEDEIHATSAHMPHKQRQKLQKDAVVVEKLLKMVKVHKKSAQAAFAGIEANHSEIKDLLEMLRRGVRGKVYFMTTVATCSKCAALFRALGATIYPANSTIPPCLRFAASLPETIPGLIEIDLE